MSRKTTPEIAGDNDFGFRLLAELVRTEGAGKDIFLSPLSIALALAMTYNGARGATQEVMAEVFGWTGRSLEEVNSAHAALAAPGTSLDPRVQLALANSIWVRNGIELDPGFAARIRTSYGGEIAALDFSDPGSAGVINRWVEGKTERAIRNLVGPADIASAIVILVNAIYFKGVWADPFEAQNTRPRNFVLRDQSLKPLPMMSRSGTYSYFETAQLQAIRLPYGNGSIGMYIFLPRTASAIESLAAKLDSVHWQQWRAALRRSEGEIALPRFKIDYGASLSSALKALGLSRLFTGEADFSGMGAGGPLLISDVIHKAFLEVNEEGTTAAAATAVISERAGGFSRRDFFTMTVNRPFLCVIADNETGAVLFAGIIQNPQAC